MYPVQDAVRFLLPVVPVHHALPLLASSITSLILLVVQVVVVVPL
jgi:hypothetical protein